MQRYIQYIFVLLIVACIAACGGGGTTAATPVYDYNPTGTALSLAPAPANQHMGGAVQGGAILNKFSNYSGSTFTGTAGSSIGFSNYTAANTPPATFNHPTDITTDGTDFYVADYTNNAIRKVTTSGGITKVTTLQCTDVDTSVTGFHFPFSLTISPDGKQLYVVDSGLNAIRVVTLDTKSVITIGSTTGVAGSVDSAVKTDVRFNRPTGITTDGDNLYVTDSGNHSIRRIDIKKNYAVSTMAGTSGAIGSTDGAPRDARFNLPQRITTDRSSLFVTDFMNRTIRKIDIVTGTVSTLAGKPGPLETATDGIGAAAHFNQPNGITTDGTNLYVTDSYLNTIRKIVIATGAVTTISTPNRSLHTPIGITTDGVSLFVTDTYNVVRDPNTLIDTYTYSNSIIKLD